jgi:hypothetical protein
MGGQGSSDGVGSRCGMEGPGITYCWRRNFLTFRTEGEPTQVSVQWVRSFPGGKAAGAWC